MKIIKPSFVVHYDAPVNYDCVKLIEQGGRICYQSNWRVTDGSAIPFTKMLVDRGHTSALEHGAVYIEATSKASHRLGWGKVAAMASSPHTKTVEHKGGVRLYTNFRVIQQYAPAIFEVMIEKKELPLGLEFFEPKAGDIYRRLTVSIVCDRGISHEIVRNRDGSFSQESTRFCNYAKDQFGNEITVIKPLFWQEEDPRYGVWRDACEYAERAYFKLRDLDIAAGRKEANAQANRSVLPNSLKTEILCTYDLVGWDFFMYLRTSTGAHPQMREITCPMYSELQEKMLSEAWGSRQSHHPKNWLA